MPRITGKWEKVSNDIMAQLLSCDVTRGRRRVINANAMVLILVANEKEYRECISEVINDLEGHLYKYERIDTRRALGNEYRYIIIFTEQPELASHIVLETDWED